MSLSYLLTPNEINLYANSITVNETVLSGDLNIDAGNKIIFANSTGSDSTIPDHINLYNNQFGFGITPNNLNILAESGGGNINNNVGSGGSITNNVNGNNRTIVNDSGFFVAGAGYLASATPTLTDTFLSLSTGTPEQNINLDFGNGNGYYRIQRTGSNKEISFNQYGNSTDTNIVFNTNAGAIIQNGAGGIVCNGLLACGGNISIGHQLLDGTASAGTAGQILTSTGSNISWGPVYEQFSGSVAYGGPWLIAQNGILLCSKIGKMVTLTFVEVIAPSTSSGIITGTVIIPLNYRPSYENNSMIMVEDQGIVMQGIANVQASGTVLISIGFSGGNFGTVPGTCGFQTFSVSYTLV